MVKSCLAQFYLQNVPPSIVKIMVVANLNIKPTESYVLMLATVKYTVELVKATSIIGIINYLVVGFFIASIWKKTVNCLNI